MIEGDSAARRKFGVRPGDPQTAPGSPFRKFHVQCVACLSYQVKIIANTDDETGEITAALVCQKCHRAEKVPP
jgi:hypothetical protein